MKYDIRQKPGAKTVLSAEKGKISLTLDQHLSPERKEAFMEVIDEILDDLHGHNFKGTFSFIGDKVEVKLESSKDKKTWTREV